MNTATDAATDAGWTGLGGDAGEVDPSGATYGRIAAGGGKVYVAFADGAMGNALTVLEAQGNTWSPVGSAGFTTVPVDPQELGITVDSAGVPWVVFTSSDADSGNYVLTVMKFTGGAWVVQGAPGFAANGNTPSLAIAAGAPYVTFVDGVSGQGRVLTLQGSTWVDISVGGEGGLLNTSNEVLGTDGTTVYLAYTDSAATQTVLLKWTGSSWASVATSPTTIDEDWAPNLSVSNGNVYLGFYNGTSGAVVLQLSNGNLVSVGALGSISGGDSIESVSATVYNGVPYVAFDDESRDGDLNPRAATVKYWDGTQWSLYAGYPNPCDIEDTVITADPSTGHLYLTYQDCNGVMAVDVH